MQSFDYDLFFQDYKITNLISDFPILSLTRQLEPKEYPSETIQTIEGPLEIAIGDFNFIPTRRGFIYQGQHYRHRKSILFPDFKTQFSKQEITSLLTAYENKLPLILDVPHLTSTKCSHNLYGSSPTGTIPYVVFGNLSYKNFLFQEDDKEISFEDFVEKLGLRFIKKKHLMSECFMLDDQKSLCYFVYAGLSSRLYVIPYSEVEKIKAKIQFLKNYDEFL